LAKIKLVVPVERGVKVKTKSGKTRTYGADRHKTSCRFKTRHWSEINNMATKRNEHRQMIIDEALDEGLKVLRKKKR
jgi:predicted DNA-binding ribbon-helix-helix protein